MYGTVELRVPLGERLVVPRTAVLDSGRRQVVFADGGDGRLVPREVRLGGRFDDAVEVLDGVAAGERVVTSANFLVDSESKLQAAESMMGMMGALGMGFSYTMDMAGMAIEEARARELGGGVYEGAARFAMGGPWSLVVQIERPGKPPLRERFTLRVAS